MPVYQEKNKNKLPKSGYSWYYRCYYIDIYGNRKQKQSKMYPRRALAKDAETDFLSKIKTTDEVDYNISFEDAYNDWLSYKKEQVKITTYYSIKKKLDKHILSWFKKYKLHSITIDILKAWKTEFLAKDLAKEYQNNIIGYLQEILAYFVDNFDFKAKIAAKLQKQRISKSKDKTNDAEINYWTLEEFNDFIKYVTNDFDRLMYNFLYYTGLRIGEMIALNWNDIDLEKKKLKISKSFSDKIENEKFAILDPKTSNSFRTIDLDDKLIDLLKKHKNLEMKLFGFKNEWYVFGNIKHTPPTTFKRHLDKWINIANVKHISPHGFRHSHASLLIYLGCDSRDVADRLGDTVAVIEKTYAHLFPEKRKITIEKLNNLIK